MKYFYWSFLTKLERDFLEINYLILHRSDKFLATTVTVGKGEKVLRSVFIYSIDERFGIHTHFEILHYLRPHDKIDNLIVIPSFNRFLSMRATT